MRAPTGAVATPVRSPGSGDLRARGRSPWVVVGFDARAGIGATFSLKTSVPSRRSRPCSDTGSAATLTAILKLASALQDAVHGCLPSSVLCDLGLTPWRGSPSLVDRQ